MFLVTDGANVTSIITKCDTKTYDRNGITRVRKSNQNNTKYYQEIRNLHI